MPRRGGLSSISSQTKQRDRLEAPAFGMSVRYEFASESSSTAALRVGEITMPRFGVSMATKKLQPPASRGMSP